jgi:hypothetical protein
MVVEVTMVEDADVIVELRVVDSVLVLVKVVT